MKLYLSHWGLQEVEPALPARMRAVLAGYDIELYIPSRGRKFLKRDEKALRRADGVLIMKLTVPNPPDCVRQEALVIWGQVDAPKFYGALNGDPEKPALLKRACAVCFAMLDLSWERMKERDLLALAVKHNIDVKEVKR